MIEFVRKKNDNIVLADLVLWNQGPRELDKMWKTYTKHPALMTCQNSFVAPR